MKITLCGSTKFMDEFHEANRELTLTGHVVYSVCMSNKGDYKPTELQKELLDLVHFAKISNSDAIFVIDVDGYVGDSTRREILWAKMNNKSVIYRSTQMARGIPL